MSVDRKQGIIDRLSDSENYTDIAWILGAPVIENLALSVVDDKQRQNMEFQAKAGLPAQVKRYTIGYCCEWCQSLTGTYQYPDVPDEVWQRHRDCNCAIEYTPKTGGKTDYLLSGSQNWYKVSKDELNRRKRYAGITTTAKNPKTILEELAKLEAAREAVDE